MNTNCEFWDWFKKFERALFDYELNQEALFDALGTHLQSVNSHLSFEISPKCNNKRELVISASGIKEAFSAVNELVAQAPCLNLWIITAFRQRREVIRPIEYCGYCISPNSVFFSLLHNKKTVGIQLFIPGYSDENYNIKQIGYLFLDEALGEYDVETKVGLIKMFPIEADILGQRYPLPELPYQFDQITKLLTEIKVNGTSQP
jgi:hypothetical protein